MAKESGPHPHFGIRPLLLFPGVLVRGIREIELLGEYPIGPGDTDLVYLRFVRTSSFDLNPAYIARPARIPRAIRFSRTRDVA